MNIKMGMNALFLSTLLFLTLFVGNAKIKELYIFYIVVVLVIGIILFYIDKKVLIAADFFPLAFFILFFINNLYSKDLMYNGNYEYYFWPLNAMLLYVVYMYYSHELKNKFFLQVSLFVFISFFYLLLLPSIYNILTTDTLRYSFVFGPNMYYRVLTILAIIILYFMKQIGGFKNSLIMILFLIPYTVGIVNTGSRGGLFMLLIVFIYFINNFIKLKRKTILLLFLLLLGVGTLVFIFIGYNIDSRLFNVAHNEGSSIGVRLAAYVYAYEHFFELVSSFGISQVEFEELFSLGDYFHYPHNFILEFLYYYGIVGAISIVLFDIGVFVVLTNMPLYQRLGYTYLVYILGILIFSSSVSGDFSDNYSVLTILFILVRILFQNKSI